MAADQQDFAAKYGPWAIVAGASDGTGAAFAEQLAERGINIVLVARRQALLDEIAGRLPTETRVVVLDLSTTDAGQRLAEATADLDIGSLVYNAGADSHSTAFLTQPIDDLRALVQRNCLTVLDACYDATDFPNNVFCSFVTRNQVTGAPSFVKTEFFIELQLDDSDDLSNL